MVELSCGYTGLGVCSHPNEISSWEVRDDVVCVKCVAPSESQEPAGVGVKLSRSASNRSGVNKRHDRGLLVFETL
jgi:hypothetical protein